MCGFFPLKHEDCGCLNRTFKSCIWIHQLAFIHILHGDCRAQMCDIQSGCSIKVPAFENWPSCVYHANNISFKVLATKISS